MLVAVGDPTAAWIITKRKRRFPHIATMRSMPIKPTHTRQRKSQARMCRFAHCMRSPSVTVVHANGCPHGMAHCAMKLGSDLRLCVGLRRCNVDRDLLGELEGLLSIVPVR